jgi:nicotinate-nucleotide--dimethylbenzimidazole phosphoribosyltransferase
VHRERWPHVESAPVEAKPRAPTVATPAIAPIDADAIEASRAHQRTLTKPAGSLGRLEDVAAWYAGVHGRFPPPPPTIARVAVFAGDHGVTVEGVSAYPSSVTAAMVANVMSGGAAIACMAKRVGVEIALVDVGVAGDLTGVPRDATTPLTRANVRAGTRNLRVEAAMTIDEARAAIGVGAKIANQADYEGVALAGVGEIGIGNTTSAAALICALTGSRPEDVVGSGTGIDDAIRARKVRVVTDALARDPRRDDPLEILASFGGLEIAAMVGFLLEAARLRLPVVLDGFLANAAALVARAIDPRVVDHLLASHASAERGSTIALATLGLKPLLDLEMRLGEGTGALLAIELVRTAVHAQLSMATFATAGIVGRAGL